MKRKLFTLFTIFIATFILASSIISFSSKKLELRDILTAEDSNYQDKRVLKSQKFEAQGKISEAKVQITDEQDNKRSIRFVAGIDSLDYVNAGFSITIKDGSNLYKKYDRPITKAYLQIEADGNLYTPEELYNDASYNYFIAYALKDIPKEIFDYSFMVSAYIYSDTLGVSESKNRFTAIQDIISFETSEELVLNDYRLSSTELSLSLSTDIRSISDLRFTLTDVSGNRQIINDPDFLYNVNSKSISLNLTLPVCASYYITVTLYDGNITYYNEFTTCVLPFTTLYANGAATGGWTTFRAFTLKNGVFNLRTTINTNSDGFLFTDEQNMSNNVFKLDSNNLKVTREGLYNITFTFNSLQIDNSWIQVKNNNSSLIGYYKVDIIKETVDSLWVYGFVVYSINNANNGIDGSNDGWNVGNGIEVPMVSPGLYHVKLRMVGKDGGFVIYNSYNKNDLQLKTPSNGNIQVSTNGTYDLYVTWNDMSNDSTWINGTSTYKEMLNGIPTANNLVPSVKDAYYKLVISDTYTIKTDLALGATATASTTVKSASLALNSTFDDTNRWESTQKVDNQWLLVDLKANYNIDEIIICWYGRAAAMTYKIEISNTGKDGDFKSIKDYTYANPIANRVDTHFFKTSYSARYIRIYGTARVYDFGYSIGKIYIYQANSTA